MLTLTRKVGESIRIGDNIQIVVKEIRKNQVRIGIIAPREVKIYREEVYQNIVAENRLAAQAGVEDLDVLLISEVSLSEEDTSEPDRTDARSAQHDPAPPSNDVGD